jgi:hypothetical protein
MLSDICTDSTVQIKRILELVSICRECSLTPGQHSRQILGELGYSQETVDQLLAAGIVEEAPNGRAKL